MQILDGQESSRKIKDVLKLQTAQLVAEGKKIPHLAAVLVGENGASQTYVTAKVKTCAEIGFQSSLIQLKEDVSEAKLLDLIGSLNNDPEVDGILVQLPLPRQISDEKVIN